MMPVPPSRDRLGVVRDVLALVLVVVGVVGVGVGLWFVTPIATVLYCFMVVGVGGFVLASGVGR